jgi:hypothetical protein
LLNHGCCLVADVGNLKVLAERELYVVLHLLYIAYTEVAKAHPGL